MRTALCDTYNLKRLKLVDLAYEEDSSGTCLADEEQERTVKTELDIVNYRRGAIAKYPCYGSGCGSSVLGVVAEYAAVRVEDLGF